MNNKTTHAITMEDVPITKGMYDDLLLWVPTVINFIIVGIVFIILLRSAYRKIIYLKWLMAVVAVNTVFVMVIFGYINHHLMVQQAQNADISFFAPRALILLSFVSVNTGLSIMATSMVMLVFFLCCPNNQLKEPGP